MQNKLWTRNFTIITLGTVVSVLGSAMSGFAISILVYDYTNSTLLFAIFQVAYHLPKVLMPIFSGPFLDRFSRRKMIYTLDFISSSLYVCLFLFMRFGSFNYALLLATSLTLGTIESIYLVAYESLYPNLITEGFYSKAYSVSSMIYPLSAVMMPVAARIYNMWGIAPIFLINACTFLTAAIFETQIRIDETHLQKEKTKYNFRAYFDDFKQGVQYIRGEKGLMIIAAYFCITMFCDGPMAALMLPYFKMTPEIGAVFGVSPDMAYSLVGALAVFGRLIGGGVHYRFKYPKEQKFLIACVVYISISVLSGGVLFLPLVGIIIIQFVTGLLGVTSYTIRISATQSYIPDDKRARFNGAFSMIVTTGSILGQLVAGVLGEVLPIRLVFVASGFLNLLAAVFLMARNGQYVKPIYNRDT